MVVGQSHGHPVARNDGQLESIRLELEGKTDGSDPFLGIGLPMELLMLVLEDPRLVSL